MKKKSFKQVSSTGFVPKEGRISRNRLIGLVLTLCMLSALVSGALVYVVATPSPTPTILESGVYPGAPSYTVWVDGSTYYVKNAYGAIDYSGTNISSLTQTMIDLSTTKSILFKAGDYYFSTGLSFKSGLYVYGEGSFAQRDLTDAAYGTNFIYTGNGIFISLLGTGALDGGYYLHNIYDVNIQNLRIIGAAAGRCGIYADNCSRIEIHNVRVQNFTHGTGILAGTGLLIRRSWTAFEVTKSSFVFNNYGIQINQSNLIYIANNEISANTKTGLAIIAGYGNNIIANNMELNGEEGIWVKGSVNDHISGNWISRSGGRGLYIANSASNPVSIGNSTVAFDNHFDTNNLVEGPSQLQVYSGTYNIIQSNYFHGAALSIQLETGAKYTYVYFNIYYDTAYIVNNGVNTRFAQYNSTGGT